MIFIICLLIFLLVLFMNDSYLCCMVVFTSALFHFAFFLFLVLPSFFKKIFFYYFFFIYNIVLVLPYINMNPPWVYTCSHPEPPSHLPPHTIPLGHPSAPAPSFLYPASNLDWRFVYYMILYMFQCHSPKSSHPLPLPQSPKDCSIHLCLFCCLPYRVVVTTFLNSIYMR